jgi:L-ascorbate 6-phosphate lactonase
LSPSEPLDHRLSSDVRYCFTRNDPYARGVPIEFVLSPLIESSAYMSSIREFAVPAESIAVWYLGQNGFLLKGPSGPLVGIDLYLTNSCASAFAHLPFRLDRQLPIFIEPEDLDIDCFITTHSHQDHADPETIRRMSKESVRFLGPFDSLKIYKECGVDTTKCETLHPGQTVNLGDEVSVTATFALPTDDTDLNHAGVLLQFANGMKFFNTGDTAYADTLHRLLPKNADVCAICVNGGFSNLSHFDAAKIVKQISPRRVVPCHYDMMVNNVSSPEMLHVAMDVLEVDAEFVLMDYYKPRLFSA